MIRDSLPEPIRVLVVSATGMLRGEIVSSMDDDDFSVIAVADARAAEQAVLAIEPHVLVAVADDLVDGRAEDLIHRVRLTSRSPFRVATLLLVAHSGSLDLLSAYHGGADDVARWPLEPDMLRARVRSIVRVSVLEASMGRAAMGGATGADLREALSQCIHLVNNAVAGISGRAQLATLTQSVDDAGLVPVCLSEARKMTIILAALHGLSEAVEDRDKRDAPAVAGTV